MCFSVVNFSDYNRKKEGDCVENNKWGASQRRASDEPMANKIKDWLIRNYVLQIIMTLNIIVLIALLFLELKGTKK